MKKPIDEPVQLELAPRKSEASHARRLGELACRRLCSGMGVTRDYMNYLFLDGTSAHFPRSAS